VSRAPLVTRLNTDGPGSGAQHPGGLGAEIEYRRHQVGAADAIHHAVVHLREQRPAAALDALQEPGLPQRPVAIQPLREDPPRQLAQLPGPPRLRHRGVPHVVADLEVLVVGPGRVEDMQRHRANDLAVARHQRELRREQPGDIPVGGGGALEDHERAKVHRHVLVLDEEEPSVERAHPLHGLSASRRRLLLAALPPPAARYA
jgi:hypothetical protein